MIFASNALPTSIALGLAGAFALLYTAARLGVAGLDRRGAGRGESRGASLAVGHWLPIAAVALAFLKDDPQASIRIIFSASAAALLLVPGVILLTAGRSHGEKISPENSPIERSGNSASAMLLPAAIICFLGGFSSHFTLQLAGILLAEGLAAMLIWSGGRRDAPTSREQGAIRPALRRTLPMLIAWIVLSTIGGAAASSAARGFSSRVPELNGSAIASLALAPVLMLPMIGTMLSPRRRARPHLLFTASAGIALLNLCCLLPLAIVAWIGINFCRSGDWSTLKNCDFAALPTLIFPLGVWRIDTGFLIMAGAALVPIASNRWRPRRIDGAAMIFIYALYLSATALLLDR